MRIENTKSRFERNNQKLTDEVCTKIFCETADIRVHHEMQYELPFLFDLKDVLNNKIPLNITIENLPHKEGKLLKRKDFDATVINFGHHRKLEIVNEYVRHFKGFKAVISTIRQSLTDDLTNPLSLRAFCKLIKFDKAWMFNDAARYVILEAQRRDDKILYDNLAEAIKYKKRNRISLKSAGESETINLINRICLMRFFIRTKDFTELSDKLFDYAFKYVIENNSLALSEKELNRIGDMNLLNDRVYFRQYLKRRSYLPQIKNTDEYSWYDFSKRLHTKEEAERIIKEL